MSFGGYVLVGGKSSRFGRDKALLEAPAGTLASRVAHAVRAAAGDAVLVGDPTKYSALGFRVIPDAVNDAGPLGGILAALEDSSSNWNLVTACDMPGIHSGFLRYLLTRASEFEGDIAMPLDISGRPQPLCAAYRRRAASAIRRSIHAGILKITSAFEGLRVLEVRAKEFAEFDLDGRLFANVNTEEEARAAGLLA